MILISKKNNPINTPPTSSRRSFLNKIWIGLGVLVLLEFVGLVFAFLLPRKTKASKQDPGSIVTAGSVDSFAVDTVTAFIRGRFYLVRLADGGFLALASKCTHLGCTVPWVSAENKFLCPCHASAFDIKGDVISAPAPRPLDIHPLTIENNMVKVDTGELIRRQRFKTEQVVHPIEKSG